MTCWRAECRRSTPDKESVSLINKAIVAVTSAVEEINELNP